MKKVELWSLLLLVTLGLGFSSCDDDDDDHDHAEVTITIEEPLDGETIADCSEVHVHIDVTSTDEIHDVEILLHPEGDENDPILDSDFHSHESEYTFEQEVNLCDYPSGTCFHLEVEACKDHDCEETVSAEAEFCLE